MRALLIPNFRDSNNLVLDEITVRSSMSPPTQARGQCHDEPTIDVVMFRQMGSEALLNWNGIIIGAAGDVPLRVTTSKNPVTSHENKCQLDSFAKGLPAIHRIYLLSTAYERERPASARLDDSREGTTTCSEYCCQVHR
jgi:hypothetical protein